MAFRPDGVKDYGILSVCIDFIRFYGERLCNNLLCLRFINYWLVKKMISTPFTQFLKIGNH